MDRILFLPSSIIPECVSETSKNFCSKGVKNTKFNFLTSVHLMTFPFALYSDPWNIFTLVIDSIDFPSIGLTTLKERQREKIEAVLEVRRAYFSYQILLLITLGTLPNTSVQHITARSPTQKYLRTVLMGWAH